MRKEQRVELIYCLRLFRAEGDEPLGYLANVTSDGIMIIGVNPLPRGATWRFLMDLPHHFSRKVRIGFSGETLWSRLPHGSPFYQSGVRFASISDEDRLLLARLAQEFHSVETGLDLSDEMNPPEITGGNQENEHALGT